MNACDAKTLAAKINGVVYYGRTPFPPDRMWTRRLSMGADAEHQPVTVYTHSESADSEALVNEGPDAFRVFAHFGAMLQVQLRLGADGEPEIPPEVNIRADGYKVQIADDMVVFSEAEPIYGCHGRFSFTLKDQCWWLELHGQASDVMVSHVIAAYEIVCQCYGPNHGIRRRPTRQSPRYF
jgi:hypothetical protein